MTSKYLKEILVPKLKEELQPALQVVHVPSMPFAVIKFEQKTPDRKRQGVPFDGIYIFIDPKQQDSREQESDCNVHPTITGNFSMNGDMRGDLEPVHWGDFDAMIAELKEVNRQN